MNSKGKRSRRRSKKSSRKRKRKWVRKRRANWREKNQRAHQKMRQARMSPVILKRKSNLNNTILGLE